MRSALVAVVLGVAGAAVLYWTTLSHASVTCEVCIRYGGNERCASAAAPTEPEAVQAATMTACGVLAGGVTGAISCQSTPPFARTCTAP